MTDSDDSNRARAQSVGSLALQAEFAVEIAALSEADGLLWEQVGPPAVRAIRTFVLGLVDELKLRGEWDAHQEVGLYMPVAPPDAPPGIELAWRMAAAIVERDIADVNGVDVRSFRDYAEGQSSSAAEHIAWCKRRALEYVDAGDLMNAARSFASDLGKHPDTEKTPAAFLFLGQMKALSGDAEGVRRWIEGLS